MNGQAEKVLNHLKTVGAITQMEALRLYGVGRLAAVVFDLKKHGHNIESERVEVKKASGAAVHVAAYKLSTKPELVTGNLFGHEVSEHEGH